MKIQVGVRGGTGCFMGGGALEKRRQCGRKTNKERSKDSLQQKR